MCLTLLGLTEPANQLCGNHGQCVENVCVCDAGWTRSLDHVLNIYSGSGAEEIFNTLKQNRSSVSLPEFVDELSLSAPCTKNTVLWNIIQLLAFICGLFVFFIIVKVQKNKQKSKNFERLKRFTLVYTAVVHLQKFLKKDPEFPFTLDSSLLVGGVAFLTQLTIYFFFVKHAKYHLKKARALYTLRPMWCGINLEKFFLYQIKYSFFLSVIGFGASVIITAIIMGIYRRKESFEFADILFVRNFQILQNMIGVLMFLYLLILCQVVMRTLLADLNTLLEFYPSTNNTVSTTQIEDDENPGRRKKEVITELIVQIKNINLVMTLWCGNGLLVFAVFIFFPVAEVGVQYFAPLHGGVFFSFLCLLLY
eukprot:maker-scaffold_30-snap-gene-3.25-mRNA-1 protein AED:0.00 eAED:0.00 QI:130/1/1/1/1/1/2/183/364